MMQTEHNTIQHRLVSHGITPHCGHTTGHKPNNWIYLWGQSGLYQILVL